MYSILRQKVPPSLVYNMQHKGILQGIVMYEVCGSFYAGLEHHRTIISCHQITMMCSHTE